MTFDEIQKLPEWHILESASDFLQGRYQAVAGDDREYFVINPGEELATEHLLFGDLVSPYVLNVWAFAHTHHWFDIMKDHIDGGGEPNLEGILRGAIEQGFLHGLVYQRLAAAKDAAA